MAKPTKPSRCTGRCEIIPEARQPSPLFPDLLICRFCRHVSKKGELPPGSKAETQGTPT